MKKISVKIIFPILLSLSFCSASMAQTTPEQKKDLENLKTQYSKATTKEEKAALKQQIAAIESPSKTPVKKEELAKVTKTPVDVNALALEKENLEKRGESTRSVTKKLSENGVLTKARVKKTAKGDAVQYAFEDYISGEGQEQTAAWVSKVNAAKFAGMVSFNIDPNTHIATLEVDKKISDKSLEAIFSSLGFSGYKIITK